MSSTELVNQFNNIYDAVESYASSSAYADFLAHTAQDGQALFEYMEGHGLKPIYNAAGDFTGGYYSSQALNYGGAGASDAALAINSNLQTGTASQANTAGVDFAFGAEKTTGGEYKVALPTEYSGGSPVQTAGNFLFGKVLPAVGAAATGVALGKKIESGLYNWDPEFFDSHGMELFNPEKWGQMADTWETVPVVGGALASGIRMLYGVKKDQTTGKPYAQPYLREDQLQYFAAYLASMGVFSDGEKHMPTEINSVKFNSVNFTSNEQLSFIRNAQFSSMPMPYSASTTRMIDHVDISPNSVTHLNKFIPFENIGTSYSQYKGAFKSDAQRNFSYTFRDQNNMSLINGTGYPSLQTITLNGVAKTGYYMFHNLESSYAGPIPYISYQSEAACAALMILDLFGVAEPAVPGTDTQTGGVVPNLTPDTDYDQIINIINNTLPDLYNNRVEIPYVDEDGNNQTIVYYPVPIPDEGTGDQPISEGDVQFDPVIDPDNATDTLLQTLIDLLISIDPQGMVDPETNPGAESEPLNTDPNPPATGEGDTPAIVMPTGSASRLWSVYNPSQAQVDAFGAWLWSSNFIDQIKKLFFDPMQAIIGIHKVFASPVVSGQGTIACGYIDSEVPSNLVGSQYTTVNCGSVNLYEYFGNVFDYDDTDLLLYLPFIGFVQIDNDHAMRGTVTVTYRVDVYTGACLAEVSVVRDGGGGVIYTFSGDCSVHYPLSSGSYMGIVSGLLTAAGGVIGGALSGNPLMIGAGVMAGATGSRAKVQHSGQVTGNSGAMGCKKPYFVIERPQTAMTDYKALQGGGANYRVGVTTVSGYTRFSDVRIDSMSSATEEEKTEIKRLLESGVYM